MTENAEQPGGAEPVALFVDAGPPRLRPEADRRLLATPYCRGPWNHTTLHGGPVSAVLADAVERTHRATMAEGSWLCSRLTIDILLAVPVGPVEITTSLIKHGRRATVIDATLWIPSREDDEPVAAARISSQWIVCEPSSHQGERATPNHPVQQRTGNLADPGSDERFDYPRPGFNCDTGDLEYVVGSHEDPGPGVSWIRYRVPVIEGEALTPLTRVAAVADLAAAAGWDHAPGSRNYINPDLTLQLARSPVGEWLAIEASTRHGQGAALLDAAVYDDDGFVGRVSQSLVVSPVTL